ncbi:MAG: hypothetical protein K2R98_22015, partial [Gemmataceae bacterium]|nr:hypothetical protein [Gemmataceae bacterium]
KPSANIVFKPGDSIETLVRRGDVPAGKQQIAQALLATVKPKPPARWEVSPAFERRQKAEQQLQQIGWALFQYASTGRPCLQLDKETKVWRFKPDLIKDVVQVGYLNGGMLLDPFGANLSLDSLAKADKNFNADRFAQVLTQYRAQQLTYAFINYSNVQVQKLHKNERWRFPDNVLAEAAKFQGLDVHFQRDAWGKPFRLLEQDAKRKHNMGCTQFDYHELVSAGPDGIFGTVDDVLPLSMSQWHDFTYWWVADGVRLAQLHPEMNWNWKNRKGRGDKGGMDARDLLQMERHMMMKHANMPMAVPGAMNMNENAKIDPTKKAEGVAKSEQYNQSTAAPAIRIREYFPETLLWKPAIITDDKGTAELPLQFADSITTWRLTASASSRNGSLGGVSAPLRVFQDFFVDLDLPVSLTQNDEVAFPVAVYNYLKEPQTVTIELQKEAWFELVDSQGLVRKLSLKPNEVTSIKFRIKARKVGYQPLTVKATGSKMHDAIKRAVDVVPDGTKVEQVFTDRLNGKVKQSILIPEHSVADASKIVVKVYPGVVSQVMEGMEGMLRMPHGCMEQTSSSAYPNVLVVDYIKKSRVANPQTLARAEQFLNAGYQRMLTFERPGGGFDWWGNGEPLVWLSAYGLHQFNDMSKVYPIDKGVIDRTQKWLMSKRNADGTWDQIGATHAETISQMGNAKLLLTSYVAWSLLDSGLKSPELEKSVEYIQTHIDDAKDNAYILALAANALAAWDAKDDRTFAVLQKLEKLKVEKPEWKAACYPTTGRSITYARDDAVTVETTALTCLAMMKSGQFTASANQAVNYLIKTKQAGGHWGSTSATILSLKALVGGLGGAKPQGKVPFTVLINGKEAGKGAVTEENFDVLQLFDLKDQTRTGVNDVEIVADGETGVMYQIVGRHFEPWKTEAKKSIVEVAVDYDRTELSTSDLLRAKATLKYNGDAPTYQVIVDLGIPPGFTVDPGDFAEMVGQKKAEKFSVTPRTVTLYVGDVKPGDVKTFEYTLKPKYPIKAKTPATIAYEYYTPANQAAAKPVELTVVEKK